MTGGANGIGSAIVTQLYNEGARVTIGDLDKAGAQRTLAALVPAAGLHTPIFVETRVNVEAESEALVESAKRRWGHVDGLVNNAVTFVVSPFVEHYRRLLVCLGVLSPTPRLLIAVWGSDRCNRGRLGPCPGCQRQGIRCAESECPCYPLTAPRRLFDQPRSVHDEARSPTHGRAGGWLDRQRRIDKRPACAARLCAVLDVQGGDWGASG